MLCVAGPRWAVLSSRSRKIVVERAVAVNLTLDFSRSYSCVVTKRGNWTMEDFRNFMEGHFGVRVC